jgi:hypothetical protein
MRVSAPSPLIATNENIVWSLKKENSNTVRTFSQLFNRDQIFFGVAPAGSPKN